MAFLAALVTARADERAYCAISPATPGRAGLPARAVFFFTVFAILSPPCDPGWNSDWNRKFRRG